MKIIEIQGFSLNVSADKELLTPEFRHYLNPLQIEVLGAKELPFQSEKNYLPIYAKYEFFDGTSIQTQKVPQMATCKWANKHVFLLGFMDQTVMKEKFNTSAFKVEIHDRDEIINENIQEETKIFDFKAHLDEEERKKKEKEEELLIQQGKIKGKPADKNAKPAEKKEAPKDDKNKKKDVKKKDVKLGELVFEKEEKLNINSTNFGISSFFLIDFLKPHVRNLKLRAPIVPNKRFEDLETKNLDLNTTARKEMKKTIFSSSYLDNDSFLVISIDLAHPIGSYVKPIKEEIEVPPQTKAPPAKPAEKKPPSREQKPPSREQKPPSREIKKPVIEKPEDLEIYERAIYIFPYKSKDDVVSLQEAIDQVNMEGLNIKEGGVRALTTYALNEEEKTNKKLDFISGFEIIDNESRVFIIEGLSDKGMKRIELAVPRNEPNSNSFKIFKNNQIKFKERLYSTFNVSLKKIRLRENLKDLLINPNIYLRAKVPENIMIVLNQISNIKKHWNLRTVVEFNLFPKSDDLISLERKYSDSLSEEDVTGIEITMHKTKKKNQTQMTNTNNSKVEMSPTKKKNAEKNAKIADTLNIVETYQQNQGDFPKSKSPLHKQKTQVVDKYAIRQQKSLNPFDAKDIYIYSSQRQNFHEIQTEELREKIRNDPHNFYTYSERYLTLSIEPYTLDQQKEREKTLSLSKMQSSKPFRTITKRNPQEFKRHDKKPPESVLDDLKENPWHLQSDLKMQSLKPSRGLPMRDKEKQDFKNYIAQKNKYFSIPEIKGEDTLLNVEKEKLMKETRLEEKKAWQEKLKGKEYFYTLNKNIQKESQLDRFKGLLHDPASKKGLLLPNSILKNTKIVMTKAIEDLPSSAFHKELWSPQVQNAAGRTYDNAEGYGHLHKYQFDLSNTPDYLFKNCIAKPTKKSVF